MIHYIKDENPEVNSAIVELANKTDLDPKAVATGAYVVYKMLEAAFSEQNFTSVDEEQFFVTIYNAKSASHMVLL